MSAVSDRQLDALLARRDALNRRAVGGGYEGARSRYDDSMQRGFAIGQQQNDIGMRERMQGRELSADMAMQGADIQSKYGLSAQSAKQREHEAAQEFGHSMARLNQEYGLRGAESTKERSHVRSMAGFEAQLREVAASSDFQRGLEKMAAEYGMSKEEATVNFQRLLEGKQQDFTNQQSRDKTLQGYGQQDMGMQAQLSEQAAQSQLGRDQQMAGTKSRYDMQGRAQQNQFDQQTQQTQNQFDLGKQDAYWDRYRDENRGLNEQRATQDQKNAMAEVNQRKDEQFDMALNDLRGKRDNLDQQGQKLLDSVESGLAELEASETERGVEFTRSGKQQLLGLIGQAGQPQRLKSRIETIGDMQFTVNPKTGEYIKVNQPERVRAMKPEEVQNGIIGFGPDNEPRVVYQPQKGAASQDPRQQEQEAFREFRASDLKTERVPRMNPNGTPVNDVDGNPLYRIPTLQESVEEWKAAQQAFAPPIPAAASAGPSQGPPQGGPPPMQGPPMQALRNAGGPMAPGMAPPAVPPQAILQRPPQGPPMQGQGTMQQAMGGGMARPAPQPPRPQNTMQGPPPQQMAPQQPAVDPRMANAKAALAMLQQKYPSEAEFRKRATPEEQRLFQDALGLLQGR